MSMGKSYTGFVCCAKSVEGVEVVPGVRDRRCREVEIRMQRALSALLLSGLPIGRTIDSTCDAHSH